MLNFTAGIRNLRAACELAEIRMIVTSRRFVEQGKLDEAIDGLSEGRRIVWLEDVRKTITSTDKALGFVGCLLARWIHARTQLTPDDPAVILFTSGSEGAPKAVV